MKLLTILFLLTISLTVTAQKTPRLSGGFPLTKKEKKQKPLTFYPSRNIDTEYMYADSSGVFVIIQNSFPKGERYTDPSGKNFGLVIFWARVINETDTPLELTISFPAAPLDLTNDFPTIEYPSDSTALLPPPYIFLPPDTMTLEKETLYNYGATGVKSFLDNGRGQPTMLQRIIKPKEACLFYIGALFHSADGAVRGELVFKDQNLFYNIRGISVDLDTTLIPCGRIVVRNEKENVGK